MNYLALCKRLRQEAGIAGSGPSTVTGQTGEYLRVTEWVAAAYEDIQSVHQDWDFLRTDITFSTSDPSISVSNFGSWKENSFRCYLTATGVSDEQFLAYIPWEQFRDLYLFGSNRSTTGRPTCITVKPDLSLYIYPTADAAYTVTGEYYKAPYTFSADADVPVFHLHHMAIVWRALMYYGQYSSEPDKYQAGIGEYERLLSKMEGAYLQSITYGNPLA